MAIRDKAITLQKKGLDAREKPKPEPAPKADDAALKSKVEGRGMKYEPDKYQYRVNKDGSVDRKPK